MAFASESELAELVHDPKSMMRLPLGAASPLWALFAGAAVSGVAWWWMSQWARPRNLEAIFGQAEQAIENLQTDAAAEAAPFVEVASHVPETARALAEETVSPAVEASEAAADAMPPVVETAMAVPEAVAESVEDAASHVETAGLEALDAMPHPVGGESAPISPAMLADAPSDALGAAPRPRRQPAPKPL